MPPLLLLGKPGIGKTRYARALAAALGTSVETINGATIPDMGSVVGYPPVWRASGPGYVAKALMHAPTSGPLIMVDEVDKIIDYDRNPHPANRLLALLERHTAKHFEDEFLRVAVRAENVIWIVTANSVAGLSEPFLDRVVTIAVPNLSREARDVVLEAMLAEVAGELGLTVTLENRAALQVVRKLGLRRARMAFELAVAAAVAQGRRVIGHADLAMAAKHLRTRAAARKEPRPKPVLRAPVGFIHLRKRRRPLPQRDANEEDMR